MLVFDTETTTDPTQRLLFGSYRYYRWTDQLSLECVEEGLFYGDDLQERDPAAFEQLRSYAATHHADVAKDLDPTLHLRSRREFIDRVFWRSAYRAPALVVGFNLPFDLSRLAVDVGVARGRFRGGFSFVLSDYWDAAAGCFRENRFRPRIGIKHLDSARAFIGFMRPVKVQDEDRPRPRQRGTTGVFQGRFLDLRTLAFALTNTKHSLASACDAFSVTQGKAVAGGHGIITDAYIDYNRRDVLASAELLEHLRAEFDRHPIHLDPCKAFSPASLSKAYLTAMRITPPLVKFGNIDPSELGATMTAYYGGRAEARVRRTAVPVVYTDFLSMYPTVNTLLGLWDWLIAEELQVVDATDEVKRLLANITLDECFDPVLWKQLGFYALITPKDDIVPVRAQYDGASDAFNIGVNRLTADTPMWYAGPDVVASALLAGHPPAVVRAFRLVPRDRQKRLRSVALGGAIPVDPARDDFFRAVIEARKSLDGSATEQQRMNKFLKVLANSGSYGVFAQMDRHERPAGERISLQIYGVDGSFDVHADAEEKPGRYCFPPMAALITAGARLMLALLERCVTDAGGTYAFCDTDSMAIVATETGGLVPCLGGPERLHDGTPAIRALSQDAVNAIVARFEALNPYDPTVVPGSILEIERENYNENGERHQLYAYVISAKRYALFTVGPSDEVTIHKYSEHGLGHLMNPTDPEAMDRDWIRQAWAAMIGEALGHEDVSPPWLDEPAVSRLTISSPFVHRPFDTTRFRLPYSDRVKPMNFVLSVPVAPFGHPAGVDPHRFHLIGAFTTDPRQRLTQPWFDIHSRERYGITTSDPTGGRIVRVKSYGDVLAEYRTHPEPKSADREGHPCDRATVGLLYRREVHVGSIVYVGKESNRLEEVEQGVVHDWQDVQDVYTDPRHDDWVTLVVPVLKLVKADVLALATGLSSRTIKSLRNGKSRPHRKHRQTLIRVAIECAHKLVANESVESEVARCAERLIRSPLARLEEEHARRFGS